MVNKSKKSFSIEDRNHVRLGRVGQALPNHAFVGITFLKSNENIACKTPVSTTHRKHLQSLIIHNLIYACNKIHLRISLHTLTNAL